jgi:hypothetical protein
MQGDSDSPQQAPQTNAAIGGHYLPDAIAVKAMDIDSWANSVNARSELPALLRRLVNSTGAKLTCTDFPAFDNSQRKGWDGYVEAEGATQWVPLGNSGWEFGCDKSPKSKAESDYTARLASIDSERRAQITFVFVTPRNWHGKANWAAKKKAEGDWKDVRAYDASDIEQWLERSASAQIWLAERLGKPTIGYRSLNYCWDNWSCAGDYVLSPLLFAPAINRYAETFSRWYDREPGRPLVVAADSRDEALAFLACLVASEKLSDHRSHADAIVFDTEDALRQLSIASPGSFIAITNRPEVERILAPLFKKFHCIIVRPRNALDADPDISLDLLRSQDFENALKDMGIERSRIDRLARESARSPTILRRRLSHPGTTRIPEWANDAAIGRKLIPAILIGAWQSNSKADRDIVSLLAEADYETFERVIPCAMLFDDPPLWSFGHFRGVTSKIDALFAVSSIITEKDLHEFLLVAEYVLSERDPALDLPLADRWAAGIYGKVRDHSAALRSGVCETLVLLAVHGNVLFFERLGFDAQTQVNSLVRRLLSPIDIEKLQSQNHDLPNYAEAAPDVFLDVVLSDLRSKNPVVINLLDPVDSSLFGASPARTGLLWGLENLAWSPSNLMRVVDILARLCCREINDNWINKPEETLKSIFRSWLPQTGATLEERIKALDYLVRQYPEVGWRICIAQFRRGPEVGHYSHRPRWRSDASGVGQAVTVEEHNKFVLYCVDIALAWPSHNEKTLSDLVQRLPILPEEHQEIVWALVEDWAERFASDDAKAVVREKIRRSTLTRYSHKSDLNERLSSRANSVLEKILPSNLVKRHRWLFAAHWVEPSYEECRDEDFNYRDRERRIYDQRLTALGEIWLAQGFDGVCDLLVESDAPFVIGNLMGDILQNPASVQEFVQACVGISSETLGPKLAGCLRGFLQREDKENCLERLYSELKNDNELRFRLKILLSMPFNAATWRILGRESEQLQVDYWKDVDVYWSDHEPEECNNIVDRLLEAGRPVAVFSALHLDCNKIESSRLKRMLYALALTNTEPMLRKTISAYEISKVMAELNNRSDVDEAEIIQLELIYLRVLRNSEHGIHNLEKKIFETPELYVQALAFAYRRSDECQDPPAFQVAPERAADVARSAYEMLEQIGRIPGSVGDGSIDPEKLKDWLKAVREQAAAIARADVADNAIGQLLSKSPAGEEGIWPCRAVCEAMEAINSPSVGDAFIIGARNSRGMHYVGDDGDEERNLARQYREWGRSLEYEFPFVASLLYGIANSYEQEAHWQDTDAKVRRRLRGW